MYTIYHNPRCGKSRDTLHLLKEKVPTENIHIIEYLKTPPSRSELEMLVTQLNITPETLLRKKEKEFEPFKNKKLSSDECFDLMIKFPKLIERPIVTKGSTAIIGRPPENVLALV